jgi:protein-S-isoprenylcysteine O-methyltransferase Ste14
VVFIVGRAIIKKQSIIGRPPVPVVFFILAKLMVFVNLVFLLLKGFNVEVQVLFKPDHYFNLIALLFLITGTVIVFLSTLQLNNDLIFGLSSSGTHKLQTTGLYSFSRHPFYLGFLFILFSSCLLTPHIINILAFAGAWIIHHFIMIREEDSLRSQYGDEYKVYEKNTGRYITF